MRTPTSGNSGNSIDQVFRQNLNRWFDDQFWGFNGLQSRSSVPVNIMEKEQCYEIEVIAPGLQKEDFQLQLNGDTLTISFDKRDENNAPADNERWLRREYRKQSFTRTFTVDDTVDADKAFARYANGMLYLTLPKKPNAAKSPRIINIQ